MTATAEPPVAVGERRFERTALAPAEGLELLGDLQGSGYKEGACLVRRADGQVVQLGPLMFALLRAADGRAEPAELAARMSERLGRSVTEAHVARLAEKLAAQGLLAGSEQQAPPKRNPLLALRWKVLVTDPVLTRRLTAPFAFLFRPWILWPVLAAFAGVCWFVLIDKGIASATAQAFDKPELLLLVFALAVASAGFHELGHAAACRYGGGTPGGMGLGIYMVWPAFYTDVTDAYRLPKRDRLRTDLGGLYFNAVVAVATMAVWLVLRVDALLLLIGLQLLQMVKQLSPVIRADGYHILSDATGVPDLFAHIGPTLRRLLPGRREPSALTGRARVLVTAWVLIVVPVLLALMLTAVIMFPRIVATAWASGREIGSAIPDQASSGQILDLLASVVRLLALSLPVLGTGLVTQKILRGLIAKGRDWSAGHPPRRVGLLAASGTLVALAAWAWWPSGQYRAISGREQGTVPSMFRTLSAPGRGTARPAPAPAAAQRVHLKPGRHLAMAMVPQGGATRKHPAMFVVKGEDGDPPVVILSDQAPDPAKSGADTLAQASSTGPASGTTSATPTPSGSPSSSPTVPATAFPFKLPSAPGPHDTQAVAVNTKDGAVTYTVAYALITVKDGANVDETNSAWAFANCNACSTVAVSFQLVLIVGTSKTIAPVNVAVALNGNCPACVTTAIADQLVVSLKAAPSDELAARLQQDLKQLDAISLLGANGSPTQVFQQVAAVQKQIEDELNASGLLYRQLGSGGSGQTSTTPTSTTPAQTSATTPTSTTPATTTTATPPPTTTTPTQTTPDPAPSSTTPSDTTTETTPTTTTAEPAGTATAP